MDLIEKNNNTTKISNSKLKQSYGRYTSSDNNKSKNQIRTGHEDWSVEMDIKLKQIE